MLWMKMKNEIRDYIFGAYNIAIDRESRIILPYQLKRVFRKIDYVIVYQDEDLIKIYFPQTIYYLARSLFEENDNEERRLEFFSKGRITQLETKNIRGDSSRIRLTELNYKDLTERFELVEHESLKVNLLGNGDHLLLDKRKITKSKKEE